LAVVGAKCLQADAIRSTHRALRSLAASGAGRAVRWRTHRTRSLKPVDGEQHAARSALSSAQNRTGVFATLSAAIAPAP